MYFYTQTEESRDSANCQFDFQILLTGFYFKFVMKAQQNSCRATRGRDPDRSCASSSPFSPTPFHVWQGCFGGGGGVLLLLAVWLRDFAQGPGPLRRQAQDECVSYASCSNALLAASCKGSPPSPQKNAAALNCMFEH